MRDRRFLLTAAASIMLLLFCVLASIACGSKSVGFPTVIRSLFHLGEETFENNVVQARIPRTVFGILAGASLSVSGALMQAVTRNPIADPSILGVNTGASLFVVCGIAFFHISKGSQYIWLAFAGAALTAVLVYGLASIGGNGATPIKLALAGAAAGTASAHPDTGAPQRRQLQGYGGEQPAHGKAGRGRGTALGGIGTGESGRFLPQPERPADRSA